MFELSTPTALSPIHGALVENLLSLKYREVYFWTGQNRIHVDFTYEYDPAANLGLRNILSLIETTLSNLKNPPSIFLSTSTRTIPAKEIT